MMRQQQQQQQQTVALLDHAFRAFYIEAQLVDINQVVSLITFGIGFPWRPLLYHVVFLWPRELDRMQEYYRTRKRNFLMRRKSNGEKEREVDTRTCWRHLVCKKCRDVTLGLTGNYIFVSRVKSGWLLERMSSTKYTSIAVTP
jgi:hypothetical protein